MFTRKLGKFVSKGSAMVWTGDVPLFSGWYSFLSKNDFFLGINSISFPPHFSSAGAAPVTVGVTVIWAMQLGYKFKQI